MPDNRSIARVSCSISMYATRLSYYSSATFFPLLPNGYQRQSLMRHGAPPWFVCRAFGQNGQPPRGCVVQLPFRPRFVTLSLGPGLFPSTVAATRYEDSLRAILLRWRRLHNLSCSSGQSKIFCFPCLVNFSLFLHFDYEQEWIV